MRRLSQPEFAVILGVTRNGVANIEYGLSPLRYQEARRALDAAGAHGDPEPGVLPFNPLWLAGMTDWPVQLSWPMLLPDPVAIGLSPPFRFSEFVSKNLPLLQSFTADSAGHVRLPESWLVPYLQHWIVRQTFADRAEKAAFALMDILAQSALVLAPTSASARRVFQQFKQTSKGAAFLEVEKWTRNGQNTPKESSIQELTCTSLKSRTSSVKIRTLNDLLESLRSLTSNPGGPAALAKVLNVPQARVSEWLSGKKKPGGETTLRLLQWVELQDRQPNTLSGATNTAKGKTQVHKSPNEKQTQVHKKE
jgi:DNA-binding transcriptional regulator YiaG